MIVADSSAFVAILENEPDSEIYARAMEQAERIFVSAVNAYETGMVIRSRYNEEAVAQMWRLLSPENGVEVVPFDESRARDAIAAFARYGKGFDPKAKLNLADCAAYALAKAMDLPPLFKGNDFAGTDIKSCFSLRLNPNPSASAPSLPGKPPNCPPGWTWASYGGPRGSCVSGC